MKDVRLGLTENEKIAQQIVGMESDSLNFHMSNSDRIENIIENEKRNKFNDKVDEYVDRLNEHTKALRESTEKLGYDISKLEIKPTFNRLLVTLFDKNPFQKVTVKGGIIVDMGGLAPTYKNTDSGEIEEAQQMILVGVVQEVGPDVKYIKVGDTIFMDRNSARPVPFYKQGLHCLSEQQVIAIVNEGLESRFEEIKENGGN